MITAEILKAILPGISDKAIEIFLPYLNTYMPRYNIDTPQRIGAFISQVGEESANLKFTTEMASGNEYEGRKDLGNIYPGDGPKYKGGGLIQITGREMYKQASFALFGDDRLINSPGTLTTPQYAAQSACWFWERVKNLNTVADAPEDWCHPGEHHYSKFQWMTILINGGLNGYDQRLANYNRARKALNF